MEDQLLQETQMEITLRLLPVIVSAAVFIIIGIVGNSLVIAFFVKTVKRTVPLQLINYLAVADLSACIAAIPIIIEMAVNVRYTQSVFCKLTHSIGIMTVTSSLFFLWVIAIDRYRKVCKPLGKQVTVSSIKYIVVMAAVFSLLHAVKHGVLFDTNEVNVTVINSNDTLKGYICSARNDRIHRHVALGFYVLDVILISNCFVTVIVTYSRIIYTLLKRRYKMRHSSAEATSSWSCRSIESTSSQSTRLGNQNTKIRFEFSSVRKPSEWKITLMMFAVSVGYLLCFTPYYVIRMFMSLILKDKEYNFNCGIQFALKLPYFNSVINPIIYCIFDVKFRNFIKTLTLKCFRWRVE